MTLLKRLHLFAIALFMGLALPLAVGAAPPGGGSLDDELLEGLNEGLDDMPAPAKPATKPDKPAASATADPPSSLDQELLENLDDEHSSQDPLARIGGKMQRAGQLIGQRSPIDQAQTLQQEIMADLDQLLEQARKQAQKQQSRNQNEQQARRDQASQPGQNQGAQGSPNQDSQNPARDSEMRVGSQPSETPDLANTRHLMQELWGHLPDRDRQQVINSTMETFIPKYEFLIKEYFKRLAETTRQRSE